MRRPLLRAALLGAAIVCGALAGEGLLVASGKLVSPPNVASALARVAQWLSLVTSLSALSTGVGASSVTGCVVRRAAR